MENSSKIKIVQGTSTAPNQSSTGADTDAIIPSFNSNFAVDKLKSSRLSDNCKNENIWNEDGLSEKLSEFSFKEQSPSQNSDENPIVLFHLETSGFRKDCDILQIAAKCGKKNFDVYINPTKRISRRATAVNGLSNFQGGLKFNGKKVESVPMKSALKRLFKWLKSFNKKCYLAAHNLSFHGPKLHRTISEYSSIYNFSKAICGFIDTLEVIRNKEKNRRGSGACSISGLCSEFGINYTKPHNAIDTVANLSRILERLEITRAILIKKARTYQDKIEYWEKAKIVSKKLLTLKPLRSTIGKSVLEKLASVGYTMVILKKIFDDSGKDGLHKHINEKLEQEGKGKLRLSSLKKISHALAEM